MNLKILQELDKLLHTSPQLLRDQPKLRQAINATFDVMLDDVSFSTLGEIVDRIDQAVLKKYFTQVWQPKTKKYKYSGLSLIDEINNLNPRSVLDLGCGYNEFKGKINNLVGVDPYNQNADVISSIVGYRSKTKFDVIIVLGSINFGSTDTIFAELENAVGLLAPGGKLFARVNPGLAHEPPESKWISFYPWTNTFILNTAEYFDLDILDMRYDSNDRMYFVWKKKDK